MSADLQEFIRVSRYARYLPEKQRRETWDEQITRVMDMHRIRYATALADSEELRQAFDQVEQAYRARRILGSQRGLQFAGPSILNKHARLYNCTATYMDRPRAFQETMWLLLCGCGVGMSVQQHHVNQLPLIGPVNPEKRKKYTIPDTIEGWSDAIGVLLSSYFQSDQPFPEYQGYYVTFDYASIRPKGARIQHMDGKAPGPKPLEHALEKMRDLLEHCITQHQTRLKPINVFDLICHASDAVLAGGLRRSAILTLFSYEDQEMMTAKTGDWFLHNAQRGRSNNSVLLLRNEITREQFHAIIESTRQFGEPGFVWSDDKETLFNPCLEISMYGYDEEGRSGFEFCNLSEINMRAVTSTEDFFHACEAAAILGTLQAGYTEFDYLGPVSKAIVEREALIGVSMTGMMDSPTLAFDPELQTQGAKRVVATNERIAALIGIRPAARCTCIKPGGHTSCLCASASGIHTHHDPRYFRRVQMNKEEETLKYYESQWPEAVEESLWSANHTDKVITFLCEVPEAAKTKRDVDALELLRCVRTTQEHWIAAGTTSRSVRPFLKHNVSNTINVRENEWGPVADYIYDHREAFCGVSLLSATGDKDYVQAPFQAVHTPHELVDLYGEATMFASGLIVHALQAFDDNLFAACACFLGIGEQLEKLPSLNDNDDIHQSIDHLQRLLKKRLWIKRAEKFTQRYFQGDKKRMTYCLKDVDALKTWCDLSRTRKVIDWTQFIEHQDHTQPETLTACAGGECELKRI